MVKAKKKPLLVNFSESESEFIEISANNKGVSKTAFIRQAIENLMKKK
jgi:hypothetical protein